MLDTFRQARRLGPLLVAALILAPACGSEPVRQRRATGSIDASPAALDFGPSPIGRAARKDVLVRNTGKVDVVLAPPALSEAGSDGTTEFALFRAFERASCSDGQRVGPPDPEGILAPGACATVTVVYAPSDLLADTATLTIGVLRGGARPLTIPLSGTGALLGAELDVCVRSGGEEQCSGPGQALLLDFGRAALGAEVRRTVRLVNSGDAVVAVTSAGLFEADASITAEPASAGGDLLPGRAREVELIFAPGQAGAHHATYRIQSNDADEPTIDVLASGTGDAPKLCFDPPALGFGSVDAGSERILALTITNCGTQDLELRALTLGPGVPFALTPPPALPLTLRPFDATSDRLVTLVRFAPQDAGPFTASLVASADYATRAGAVELEGTGVARSGCAMSAAGSLEFGSVLVGNMVRRDLRVTNVGTGDCTVQQPVLASGAPHFRLVASTYPRTLGTRAWWDVGVEYAPQAAGPHAGQLSVPTSDPAQGSLLASLAGSATVSPVCKLTLTPPGTAADPAVLDFGPVPVRTEKILSVGIKNDGGASCSIGGAQLYVPWWASAFTLVAPPPATLAPGTSTQVDIKFVPSSEERYGPDMNGLQVNTSDTSSDLAHLCTGFGRPYTGQAGCRQVGFAGQGAGPPPTLTPDPVDFGLVTVSCGAARRVVTIQNPSLQPVTVSGIAVEPSGGPFTKVSAPGVPFDVDGYSEARITLGYDATAAQADTGTLTVTTSRGQRTVALVGAGAADASQTDTFAQPARPTADVLMVVDDSGSMFDKQSLLSRHAAHFLAKATAVNADYQIGVVTTDMDAPHEACSIFDGDCAFPGTTITPAVIYGDPRLITSATPRPSDALSDNVRVGTNGSGSEQGLAAAIAALSEPRASDPARNGGFAREGSKLSIVILSDEEDFSPGSVDTVVSTLRDLRAQRGVGTLSLSAIVGNDPDGCENADFAASPGARYIGVASRTRGLFRSICSGDFGTALADVGGQVFSAQNEFHLSRPVSSGTLSVKVNGAASPTSAWSYDPVTNSVVFVSAAPAAGATIEARYTAACP